MGTNYIRDAQSTQVKTIWKSLQNAWNYATNLSRKIFKKAGAINRIPVTGKITSIDNQDNMEVTKCANEKNNNKQIHEESPNMKEPSFWKHLFSETKNATFMVAKFMLFAWFLGALIRLYVPESWITSVLGDDNPMSIITAAFLGIPAYTSSLAALPIVGGLLEQGMHPAAALAFLIAGPTTTLPAMSAVWGLVDRKVFSLYVGFSLFGAILLGYLYSFFL